MKLNSSGNFRGFSITSEEGMKQFKHKLSLHFRGTGNNAAKITEAQAREIRYSTASAKFLSKKFDLHIATIWKIKAKILWKHI